MASIAGETDGSSQSQRIIFPSDPALPPPPCLFTLWSGEQVLLRGSPALGCQAQCWSELRGLWAVLGDGQVPGCSPQAALSDHASNSILIYAAALQSGLPWRVCTSRLLERLWEGVTVKAAFKNSQSYKCVCFQPKLPRRGLVLDTQPKGS